MNAFVVFLSLAVFVDKGLSLLFVVAIFFHFVFVSAEVKRRGGDVKMPFLNDAGHETVEKRHDERVDMRTIDVGIGHDNDFIVTQFVDVGLFVVFAFDADTYADTLNNVHHRFGFEHFMPLHFLYVEDFSFQRKDRLRVAIAALLGRTACRIALDKEDFGSLWVFVRAVGQFSGQSASRHRVLPLYAFACLSCCDARRSGQYHLVTNLFCLFGMFFQIISQSLSHGLLNGSRDLTVAQFGFRLTFELRLGYLN